MQRRNFLNLGAAGVAGAFAAGFPLPRFIPRPSREKWAVLFGTWSGTTRDAGIRISEGMGGSAAVFDVRQNPDLSPFDHLVVGTAIHGGRGPRELDDYIQRNLPRIEGKIRGLYAVCGSLEKPVGPQQVEDLLDRYLAAICKSRQVPKTAFNGRITKTLMSEED